MRIPTYQRKEQLTTQAPSVKVSAGEAGRTMGALAQGAAQLSDKAVQAYAGLEKARRYQQSQDYELTAIKGINEQVSNAIDDVDNTGDLTEYENALTKVKNNALSRISNEGQRDRLSLDFDLRAENAKVKIRGIFRKNMIDKGRSDTLDLIENYQQAYAQSGDKTLLKTIESEIEEARKQGFWGDETTRGIKKNAIKKAKEARLNYDILTNPALAEKRMEANFYGFDAETKKVKDKEMRLELRRIQTENENEIAEAFLNNPDDISETWILEQLNNGKISASFTKSMISNIEKHIEGETDFNSYIGIMDNILNPDKTATEIRAGIMRLHASGKLSTPDTRSLLFTGKMGQDPIFEKYIEEQKSGFLEAAWKMIKDTFSNPLMPMRNVLTRLTGGEKIEDTPAIAQEEIDKENTRTNPNRSKYKVGDIVTNPRTGKNYKVTGYDSDGEPLVDEIIK